ncbi:hypothetical protein DPMN_016035 [Dreissena polymorpha]|uniref:Secreted protein n=1 Tax=Dreissena polymorpha TaxID=45954 RepID=A0A9D4NCK9_DREPO|nr:hypothetical protein DPMN_016035 [Dreissena polymorpha]
MTMTTWASEIYIILFVLPAHSSRLTQPLDIGPKVQPMRIHKHYPRSRHSQKISTRRPRRVFTRRIAEACGIDPRNNAESVVTLRTFAA